MRALELERPHVAGNSLGGLLALDLGRANLARSVTALSPAGFWSQLERQYAFTVLTGMRRTAERMPLPLVEWLSRSAAGRATLTSTIYARPGRRSPESVVAETVGLARAEGFFETLHSGREVQFTDDVSGIPVTVAWGSKDRLLIPRQASVRSGSSPGPAGAPARLRPCADERRSGPGRPGVARRQPLSGPRDHSARASRTAFSTVGL